MVKYICYSSKVFKDFISITKVQVRQHVIEITSIGYLCKKDAIKNSNRYHDQNCALMLYDCQKIYNKSVYIRGFTNLHQYTC